MDINGGGNLGKEKQNKQKTNNNYQNCWRFLHCFRKIILFNKKHSSSIFLSIHSFNSMLVFFPYMYVPINNSHNNEFQTWTSTKKILNLLIMFQLSILLWTHEVKERSHAKQSTSEIIFMNIADIRGQRSQSTSPTII